MLQLVLSACTSPVSPLSRHRLIMNCLFIKQDRNSIKKHVYCEIFMLIPRVTQHRIYYTFTTTSFLLFPMLVLFASSLLLVKALYFLKVVKSANRRKKGNSNAFQTKLKNKNFRHSVKKYLFLEF